MTVAPAAIARAIILSGLSQNNSTRVDVIPSFKGLSQPLLAGSPRKNGAPAISRPATDPKSHRIVAFSDRLYHSTAVGVSETASITDMAVLAVSSSMFPLALTYLMHHPAYGAKKPPSVPRPWPPPGRYMHRVGPAQKTSARFQGRCKRLPGGWQSVVSFRAP